MPRKLTARERQLDRRRQDELMREIDRSTRRHADVSSAAAKTLDQMASRMNPPKPAKDASEEQPAAAAEKDGQ